MIRQRVVLALARFAQLTHALAAALAVDITLENNDSQLMPQSGPIQVDVGMAGDGQGVCIQLEAVGGEDDGRRILSFIISPTTAHHLADNLCSVATHVARMNDDTNPSGD